MSASLKSAVFGLALAAAVLAAEAAVGARASRWRGRILHGPDARAHHGCRHEFRVHVSASVHRVRREGREREYPEVVGGLPADAHSATGTRGWTRDSVKTGDTLAVIGLASQDAPNVVFARRVEDQREVPRRRRVSRSAASAMRNACFATVIVAAALTSWRRPASKFESARPSRALGSHDVHRQLRQRAERRPRQSHRSGSALHAEGREDVRREQAGLRPSTVHAAERSAGPLRAAGPASSSQHRDRRAAFDLSRSCRRLAGSCSSSSTATTGARSGWTDARCRRWRRRAEVERLLGRPVGGQHAGRRVDRLRREKLGGQVRLPALERDAAGGAVPTRRRGDAGARDDDHRSGRLHEAVVERREAFEAESRKGEGWDEQIYCVPVRGVPVPAADSVRQRHRAVALPGSSVS